MDNKTNSLYARNSLSYGPFFSTQGIRYHRHDPFGEHTAYALEVGAHIHHTTFKAKMATGLKVPSLYQSFAPFGGNPDLRPESGRTIEFGLIQDIPGGDIEMTAFQVQSKNLIDWDTEVSRYINIKQTRSHGLELAATVALWPLSSLSLYTTYTKAIDKQTNKLLLKRPKWKRGMTLKNAFGRSKVALDWNFIGASSDYGDVPLSSYHLVHLRASYHFKDQSRLQAKVGNVFNKTYEETAGYAVLGRHASIQYAINL